MASSMRLQSKKNVFIDKVDDIVNTIAHIIAQSN